MSVIVSPSSGAGQIYELHLSQNEAVGPSMQRLSRCTCTDISQIRHANHGRAWGLHMSGGYLSKAHQFKAFCSTLLMVSWIVHSSVLVPHDGGVGPAKRWRVPSRMLWDAVPACQSGQTFTVSLDRAFFWFHFQKSWGSLSPKAARGHWHPVHTAREKNGVTSKPRSIRFAVLRQTSHYLCSWCAGSMGQDPLHILPIKACYQAHPEKYLPNPQPPYSYYPCGCGVVLSF